MTDGLFKSVRGMGLLRSPEPVVSFAAVIRVVTRHATLLHERCVTSDDPNNGCEGDYLGASSWMNCISVEKTVQYTVIKEKHINLFERFIVYGLAKIQRDSKYPIACAPEYSRNLLSAQHFYLQSKYHL